MSKRRRCISSGVQLKKRQRPDSRLISATPMSTPLVYYFDLLHTDLLENVCHKFVHIEKQEEHVIYERRYQQNGKNYQVAREQWQAQLHRMKIFVPDIVEFTTRCRFTALYMILDKNIGNELVVVSKSLQWKGKRKDVNQ